MSAPKAITRLALCKDILNIRQAVDRAPDAQKINARVLAGRRIGAIRKVLLNRPGRDLLDDLMSPSVGLGVLLGAMEAVKSAPQAEMFKTALLVQSIYNAYRSLMGAEERAGINAVAVGATKDTMDLFAIGTKVVEESQKLLNAGSDGPDALVDENISNGHFDDAFREQVAAAFPEAKKAVQARYSLKIEEVAPEIAERMKAAQLFADECYRAFRDIETEQYRLKAKVWEGQFRADEQSVIAEHERLKALRDAAWAKCLESDEALKPLNAERAKAITERVREMEKPLVDIGNKAITDILDTSPVTPGQATAWANSQEITKTAIARLKKTGYPVEDVRRDMAEFYRLTAGRVSSIRLHSKGDRRANATDIGSHGYTGTIHMDGRFDKRVLWHEMAHHLEADPVARQAAGRFIRRRSVDGGKTWPLRTLTKNNGYRPSEKAYKDHFFSEYVGKVYGDGITEVFSMGVESFSDPLTLGKRIAEDPQTLEFVAGYLKAPVDPLTKVFQRLRDTMREATGEANEEKGDAVADMIKALAKDCNITSDTNRQWLKDADWDWGVKGEQVGQIESTGWYVFRAPVKNFDTGRKMTGVKLYRTEYRGESANKGVSSYSLRSHDYPTKDLDVIRAIGAAYLKSGVFPSWNDINNEGFLRKYVSPNDNPN